MRSFWEHLAWRFGSRGRGPLVYQLLASIVTAERRR
jgi:hypothetical protein